MMIDTIFDGRFITRNDRLCRLMGMHPRRMKVVVSENQFAKQLGNSMTVNVLERIRARALPAAGLTAPLRDRWASEDAVAALEATRDCKLRQDWLAPPAHPAADRPRALIDASQRRRLFQTRIGSAMRRAKAVRPWGNA